MEQGFPSTIAARLAGVTPKTLENWDNRGFFRPTFPARPITGRRNFYTFRDLIAIRVADDLRARGIDTRHLRRVVDYVRARKGLELTATDVGATAMLVSTGEDVYEVDGEHGVSLSTLRDPDRAVLVVPLGRHVAKIKAEALKVLQRAA